MKASKKNTQISKKRLKKNVRLDALNPQFNPKIRRQHLDADYLKKLSPDVLKWYAQFIDEYTHASIRKTQTGQVRSGYLHNTPELAKQCYDANNYRNNDLMSIGSVTNLLHDIDNAIDNRDGWYITNHELTENAIISQLDSKDQYDELSFKEYIKIRHNMGEERRKILDMEFSNQPYADLYYSVYIKSKLNDYQLDTILKDITILKKLVKYPKFFKRKKYRTD